jgi:hypothetical protein
MGRACTCSQANTLALSKKSDINKIKKISIFINLGENSKPHWRLLVNKLESLVELDKKQFSVYPLLASKKLHYEALMKVVMAHKDGLLTDSVFRNDLQKQIWAVNKEGKRRDSKKPD